MQAANAVVRARRPQFIPAALVGSLMPVLLPQVGLVGAQAAPASSLTLTYTDSQGQRTLTIVAGTAMPEAGRR